MYLQMKDVVKKYGEGENTIYALDHASPELEKGEICVVLGPSGSGKSTLLNMLGGLDSADEGTIIVDGSKISSASKKELLEYRRNKVGIVFQTYNLIGELTVRENINVVRDISKAPLSVCKAVQSVYVQICGAYRISGAYTFRNTDRRSDNSSRSLWFKRNAGAAQVTWSGYRSAAERLPKRKSRSIDEQEQSAVPSALQHSQPFRQCFTQPYHDNRNCSGFHGDNSWRSLSGRL